MLWSYVQASTDVRPKVVWSYSVRANAVRPRNFMSFLVSGNADFYPREIRIYGNDFLFP